VSGEQVSVNFLLGSLLLLGKFRDEGTEAFNLWGMARGDVLRKSKMGEKTM